MRLAPVLAALVVLAVPATSAAAGGGLQLTGPSSLDAAGPVEAPLRVTLALANVVCARDTAIPVDLSVVRARGVRAAVEPARVLLPIGAGATAARGWSASAEAVARVEPTAALGIVEVQASYQLPPGCAAAGGAASGVERHTIRIEQAGAPDERSTLPTVFGAPVGPPERAAWPASLQAAVAATLAGGFVVLVKRLRARTG